MQGTTRWARSGDAQIAYRRSGAGPTVVMLTGTFSSIAFVDLPTGARYAEAISRFGQLLVWDPRGIGASDPRAADSLPTVEGQVADLLVVLDDARVQQAWLHGFHVGVPVAAAFAATHPDRVAGLHLVNGWARAGRRPGESEGFTTEEIEGLVRAHGDHFGTGMFAEAFCPSRAGDPEVRQELALIEQRTASRHESMVLNRFALELDVDDLLPRISAPTVVMNSDSGVVPPGHAERMAAAIPGARFVALSSTDHAYPWGDPEPVLEELEALVTGHRPDHGFRRAQRTLLFTDLVGSTARASTIGDSAWRALLDRHDELVREQLTRFDGTEVNTAGDGFLATFTRSGRAVACALALGPAMAELGLELRAGIHVGEVELRGDDVGGITVHTASRIAAEAQPGEVLVSRTVVDVLAGSDLEVGEPRVVDLRGVPRTWELYPVLG